MEIAIVISLVLLAVVLLIIEMFLIPGISIAGVGGILFAVIAVVLAFWENSTLGFLTLFGIVFIGTLLIWIFIKSKALEKMSLQSIIDSSVGKISDMGIAAGEEGISISRLAPMGKVLIKGKSVEAKTAGEFIDEETPVVVEKVFDTNILVRSKSNI